MNIKHHPSEELLFDYSSGAIKESWGLAVATHLSFCPSCRNTVAEFEAIGGSLLETISAVPLDYDGRTKYDSFPSANFVDLEHNHSVKNNTNSCSIFPKPLQDYVGNDPSNVEWKRLGFGISQSLISMKENDASVRLLNVPAGSLVPEHSHNGLELTLVLSGAFSDETGEYHRGDIQEATETLMHQPRAMDGQNCICLVVTNAPLNFKNLAFRTIQPMIGI